MNLIDTHTHLFSDQFNEDRNEVVKRAINLGISKLFLPNINSSTIEPMLDLCKRFPNNCFAMIGLHPCNVKEDFDKELIIIRENLEKGLYIAVGEIGIDLYWEKSTLSWQKKLFALS